MPERKKPFPEVPLPESEDSESESVSVTEPEMSEIEPETPEAEFEVTEQDSGEENLSVPKIPMANSDSEVAVKADPTEVEEEYYDEVLDADVELEVSDLGDQTIDAEEYDDDYEEYSDLSPEQNQDTKNEAPSSDSSETAVAHPQKPARKTAIRKVRSLDEYVLNNGDYTESFFEPKANSFTVQKDILLGVLRSIQTIQEDIAAPVVLTVKESDKEIEVSYSGTTSKLTETITIDNVVGDGNEVKIGLNGLYLTETLKAITSERVKISYVNSTTIVLLEDNLDNKHIIVPVRLSK